jgi:hypothetical protein
VAGSAVVVVAAVMGGVGTLYLLRRLGVLGYGPDVAGALPLQRLDRSDPQPLVRVAAAWLPAGMVAGLAVRRHLRAPVATVVVALVAVVLLIAFGAVSDAATVSGAVGSHVSSQVTRTGTWVAAALMTVGASLVHRRRRAALAAPTAP